MKLGSHVGMSGKEMLLGSAKEAVSYGANTFMFYTGAPQNTRRKEISELNISSAWEYMKEHGIDEIIVHAPYIINLCKLFKCAADFGTFSGHGFQCDMTGSICCQDSVESFDDLADSGVSSGSYMRTRMKYQSMAFAGGSALNLLCQEFDCKFKCFRFYRISQIDDIGSMYDDFVNAMFFHIFPGR